MNPIIMRFRHIAVSLSCLCLAQLLNAQLTHTVTFDRNLLSIDTTVVDSVFVLENLNISIYGGRVASDPPNCRFTTCVFGPLQCLSILR